MRRIAPILLGLSFTLPLLAAMGCDGCQNAIYKVEIEKALHEDALTGTDPTYGHTASMRKVDISNCPPEFREAYMKHIHAWEERAAVQQAKAKIDSEEDAAATAGLLAAVFGSDATPWADHQQAEQELQRLNGQARQDISSTWQDVEVIASKYGAQVPH